MRHLSIFIFLFCTCILRAQVPFVEYKVVPNYQVNAQGVLVPIESGMNILQNNQIKKQGDFPIIGGYTITQNGKLKRVKIKVNLATYNGINYAYLRGVQTQNPNIWNECNVQAIKIDEYADSEFIVNNFEWKVDNAIYGTIYFNY